ncbi:hypothetical protein ACQ86E_18965 [Bradyrhizobium betae]|uniref:hypothetical protein n=1 Tax=Bradyrhizobium betae TaxID=244734 RepID=UPI003D664740
MSQALPEKSFGGRHLKALPALFLFVLASCGQHVPTIMGRWNAEKSPAISLYFYPDGTASLSGTGLLRLEWKELSNEIVRIDVLEKKIIFHFKLKKDAQGTYGTLELAGYDTLVFRKE